MNVIVLLLLVYRSVWIYVCVDGFLPVEPSGFDAGGVTGQLMLFINQCGGL